MRWYHSRAWMSWKKRHFCAVGPVNTQVGTLVGTLQGADRFDDAWFFFTAGGWPAASLLCQPATQSADRPQRGIAPLTPAATMTRRVDHVAVDHALRRAVPRRCLCQTTASTRGSSACLTTSACLVRLPPPTRQHACLTGTADTVCRGDPALPFRARANWSGWGRN